MNLTLSFSAFCAHCGEPWCVGPDYPKMRAQLPQPLRAGTFKIRCPYCKKRNPVQVKKEGPQ